MAEEKTTERKYSRQNTLDEYINMKVGAMDFEYSMDAHEFFLKFAPLLPKEKQTGNRRFDWENAVSAKMSEKELEKICSMSNEAYALSREGKPFVFIHKPQMYGHNQRVSGPVDTTVVEVRTNDRRSVETDGTVGAAIQIYAERGSRKIKGVMYLDHFDLKLFERKFDGAIHRRVNLSNEDRRAFTNKWIPNQSPQREPTPNTTPAPSQEINPANVIGVLGLGNFKFV